MKYLIIDADTGELRRRTAPRYEVALRDLGPEGWDHVWLDRALPLMGWVNDLGLTMPDVYPRNVVGSLMLMTLGARPMPYAGPVILTGWDHTATGSRDRPEVVSLDDLRADTITRWHTDIQQALAGAPSANPFTASRYRQLATLVRGADTPQLTVIDPADPSTRLPYDLLTRQGGS